MINFTRLKKLAKNVLFGKNEMEASMAYDFWSATYDEQNNNPVIYLDEIIFDEMTTGIEFKNKIIVDIGCGTGRHWKKIFAKAPKELIGYEVSKEMLTKLHLKYPAAKTFIDHNNELKELSDQSCDIIISTLVIGYIKDLSKAFSEWNRVLKKGGEIIITDFHPEMLQRGATRSFKHNDKLYLIKNYIHPIAKIEALSKKLHWSEKTFIEKKVDERIKHFYEKFSSIDVYNRSINDPIIYGLRFLKNYTG